MTDYQIFTDATADLPLEYIESLGAAMIPMTIEMEGQDYITGSKDSTLTIQDFYKRLASGEVARTSQINAVTFNQYFGEELKKGRDVIMITLSSALSKSYETGEVCAEKLRQDYPDRKVHFIDSRNASLAEGVLVYTAAQMQKQGKSVDEVADWIISARDRLGCWVTVDDLSYLQRGGRISTASAAVGTMLNIKPIIYMNEEGKLININKVRGRKKSLDALAEAFRDRWIRYKEEPVIIGYGSYTVKEDAEYLRDQVKAGGGPEDVWMYEIGPVIGAHTGPSVVAMFYLGDKK
ncbi:MAG: DegV family protein [Peptococcaceae bacterium]|jgi:DegV family protein with EDD domain|nr:DegV family protein [Peptococcaceae bacterium]